MGHQSTTTSNKQGTSEKDTRSRKGSKQGHKEQEGQQARTQGATARARDKMQAVEIATSKDTRSKQGSKKGHKEQRQEQATIRKEQTIIIQGASSPSGTDIDRARARG